MAKGIAELPNDTVTDGEIVALDENGRPSFQVEIRSVYVDFSSPNSSPELAQFHSNPTPFRVLVAGSNSPSKATIWLLSAANVGSLDNNRPMLPETQRMTLACPLRNTPRKDADKGSRSGKGCPCPGVVTGTSRIVALVADENQPS